MCELLIRISDQYRLADFIFYYPMALRNFHMRYRLVQIRFMICIKIVSIGSQQTIIANAEYSADTLVVL